MTREQEGQAFPLGLATEGLPLRIVSLRAGHSMDHRLAELGLHIGSVVSVVQRQGGGVVVARDAARIAVGGGMAMKIMVVPVSPDGLRTGRNDR